MKTQEGRGRVWQFQRFLSGIVFAFVCLFIFFLKQKTAYEITTRLVGSEMCIRDRRKIGYIK